MALRRPNARAAADDQNVFLAGFFTLAWLAVVICPVLGATALHRLQMKTIRRAQRLSRCLRDGNRSTTRLVYMPRSVGRPTSLSSEIQLYVLVLL